MADAFAVVRKRGIYMQEAVPTGGAMTAVLGLDPQVIEDICKKTAAETNSVVSVANYNCGTDCYHRRKGSSRCRRSSMQRGRCQEMRTAQGQRTFPLSNA